MTNIPISAKAVANYFLELAKKNKQILSPMKLQKLVYFAHGWCLGLFGKPLINEAIEAWKYGPVIESLYHEFKRFGNENITDSATDVEVTSDCKFKLHAPQIPENETLKSFLNKIWDVYSPFTPIQLSVMTHQPGSPWEKVWEAKGKEENNAEIDPSIILEYFKGRSNE